MGVTLLTIHLSLSKLLHQFKCFGFVVNTGIGSNISGGELGCLRQVLDVISLFGGSDI